ncbi:hypothetical protein [uncultured Mediterranean phage]|nr:hypothetical protein [uncultured Mediterranean phage]
MIYIMKNHRIDFEKNQYILFDDVEHTRATMEGTPAKATALTEMFEMTAVSPLDVWKMMDFNKVEPGVFYPLPF